MRPPERLWPILRRVILLGVAALSMSSCAPGPKPLPAAKPNLPGTYERERARSNAPLRWSDYFQDGALKRLISRAVAHNYDLRMALQRVEVARAWVRHATGTRLPRVGLGAGVGVRKFGLYTMDGAGNATTDITPGRLVPEHLPDYSVGLEASWELDLWGKLESRREAALARYLASLEGTNLVITTVVAETARSYFELVAADGSLEISKRTLERQERALEVMKLQKRAGRVNELAVQQFFSQVTSTRALQAEFEQRSTELENQLSVLLGGLPETITRDTQALDSAGVAVLPGVPSDLLLHRPDIRQAELELRASKFDVEAARAAFYPNVEITAGVGLQAFNPRYLVSVPESLSYGVSAGLFAPLINRNALHADFEAATASQLEALYQYQKAIITAFAEVATALASLERLERIVEQRSAQRETLARAVDTAALLFNTGNATYLEVLSAEQQTLSAELELIEALKTRRTASLLLYKAVGGGWR